MQIWIDDDYADVLFESMLREKIKDLEGWVDGGNYWNDEDRENDMRLLVALRIVLKDYSVMERLPEYNDCTDKPNTEDKSANAGQEQEKDEHKTKSKK